MGGSTIATSDTRLEALKLQSSTYGATIPLVWGMARLAANLIWYGAFTAIPDTSTSSGGKGGTRTQNTTFTYTASLLMAICEGPIIGAPRIWVGNNLYDGSNNGAGLELASETSTGIVAGNSTVTVVNASNFSALTIVYGMRTQPDGPPQFEPLADGVDFTHSGGTVSFNLDGSYSEVNINYTWDASKSWANGLVELGFTLFNGDVGQAPWTYLQTQFANQSVGYTGTAYVAAQDYPLGGDASLDNHNFEVYGKFCYSVAANVPDANPRDILFDAFTNDRYGIGMPTGMFADSLSNWSNYCLASGVLLSPALTEQQSGAEFLQLMAQITNTGPVWSGSQLKMVPYGDANLSGQGPTTGLSFRYTAFNEAVYDLDDDDYINLDDPIKVTRTQQTDAYNHVTIEYLDRSNDYNVAIAEASDQASIDQYGMRTMSQISCHWICDPNVANIVAQMILQRAVYIRNTYVLTVPWIYVLLEPMDLIEVSDTEMGYQDLVVRITKWSENADGDIELTCEDFPLGVASLIEYPRESGEGYSENWNVSPGNVMTPVIFEMPGSLTTTGLELGIAVTGNSPAWGGCDVWASYEGDSYVLVGTVQGGSRYGQLASSFSTGEVDVQMFHGQLNGVSSNASLLGTLCYVGGASQELFAYESATLTGNGQYHLTGLSRGAYETAVVAHNIGDPFVRIDDAIAVSAALDKSLIGTTVFIKMCSFNIYGGAKQSLADVDPFSYVVTGIFVNTKAGIRTFQQNEEPTDQSEGDLWMVPSTGITYRWDGTQWVIYTTIGANEDTFTGIVGVGNLLPYSSFRDDVDSDGMADGWLAVDNESGNNPLTIVHANAGGLFGTGAQLVSWNGPNHTRKGIIADTGNGAGLVGGWQVGTEYMVSGYAMSNSDNVGDQISLQFTIPPLKIEAIASPVLSQSFQRFVSRITWGSSVEANGAIGFAINGPTLSPKGGVTFTAVQVTEGNILTEWVEAIPDIRRAASDAQTAADNAANMAQVALDGIGAAVSDNLLAPSEKRNIIDDYNELVIEYNSTVAQAIDFNVSYTTYNAAQTALTTYLGTLTTPTAWNNLGGSTTIVGTTFLSKFSDVYTAREVVLQGIAATANLQSQNAQASANAAASNATSAITAAAAASNVAATAQNIANQASANANTALASIGIAASDNTIVPSEKRAIIVDYNSIISEQSGIDAQAANYGITTEKTGYDGSVANLTSYLATANSPTLWSNIAGATNVVGATFVAKFQSVYDNRQTLLNKISQVALVIANNAVTTANAANSNAAQAQIVANQALANVSAAYAAANAANSNIVAITSDNILAKGEKSQIIQDVAVITSEYPNIVAQATSYGVTTELTNYNTTHSNLTNYLSVTIPTWNNVTVDTTINGPTFRLEFSNYYSAKEVVLLAIAAAAGTTAVWDGVIDVPPSIFKNLIDPSWWSPIATFQWPKNDDVTGETTIIYAIGPKGSVQAVVRGVAAGTPDTGPDGGWSETGFAGTNAFAVDPTKCYRFCVPIMRVSGHGNNYWGVSSGGQVCNLNTATGNTNPYLAQIDNSAMIPGRWHLFVGYVFPAGTTTSTNDGAGVFDLTTGNQVLHGQNMTWAAGAYFCSTRAYQFYADTGSETRFGYPFVNVVDGSEPSISDLYADAAFLNSNQQWSDVQNIGVTTLQLVSSAATDVFEVIDHGAYTVSLSNYNGPTNSLVPFNFTLTGTEVGVIFNANLVFTANISNTNPGGTEEFFANLAINVDGTFYANLPWAVSTQEATATYQFQKSVNITTTVFGLAAGAHSSSFHYQYLSGGGVDFLNGNNISGINSIIEVIKR